MWCDKCSAVLAATLRPAFLGSAAGLSAAAFLDTAGCTLADVPRFGLLLMCACGAEREVSDPARGRRVRDGCRECHSPQPLYFSNVTLVRHAGAAGGGGGGGRGGGEEEEEDEMESLLKKLRKKNASQLASLGLSVGKPLPNKGACKHFKHSYRWLRFPCCGRAHPCATCHAASDCPAAAAGQAVWATRMLCGKCSREMPYSDRPCSSCGNTFTRPGGGHWQGGDGCRDQTRLAKSDSRKHKARAAPSLLPSPAAVASLRPDPPRPLPPAGHLGRRRQEDGQRKVAARRRRGLARHRRKEAGHGAAGLGSLCQRLYPSQSARKKNLLCGRQLAPWGERWAR